MKSIDRRTLLIGGVVGLLLGLLLGMLFFWQAFPVKWTNGQSYDLAPEARAEYVTLLADVYKADKNRERAVGMLELWRDDEKQRAFSDAILVAEASGQNNHVQALQDLARVLAVPEQPAPPPVQPRGLLERLRVPCLVFVIVLLTLVLAMIAFRMVSRRRAAAAEAGSSEGLEEMTATHSRGLAQGTPQAEEWKEPAGSPLGPWIAAYKLGEDAYDESFRIETRTGDYLGECGMGILDIIGTGKPDQVTAFEVWLFDKNDIRTVTKVLMSEYAFQDAASRAKLASKGEAMLAQLGTPFTLETRGLQVTANATELEYGQGDLSPNSFFSKLTIELVAKPKQTESSADPLR